MKKLGIITITYSSVGDVCKTLRSINEMEKFCIIDVIHKELTLKNEEYITNKFPLLEIVFHRQENRGIYDAMNIGIEKSKSKYVYFLNAGDECSDVVSLKEAVLNEARCGRILVFDSFQIFGLDKYRRSSRKSLLKNEFKKIAHQAIIVPTSFARENTFMLNIEYRNKLLNLIEDEANRVINEHENKCLEFKKAYRELFIAIEDINIDNIKQALEQACKCNINNLIPEMISVAEERINSISKCELLNLPVYQGFLVIFNDYHENLYWQCFGTENNPPLYEFGPFEWCYHLIYKPGEWNYDNDFEDYSEYRWIPSDDPFTNVKTIYKEKNPINCLIL